MDNLLKNNLIQQALKITLLTHINPDGDGISACAALEHCFKKLNKQIETIYPCKPDIDFKRQPENFFINKHNQTPDLIIACDTTSLDRAYYPDNFKNIPLINIDHHISNTISGTCNFVEPDYSSACEVLFFLIQDNLDTYAAECLLYGIIADTCVFQTQSTKAQTLHVAAKLIDLGANLYQLKSEYLGTKDPQTIMLWGSIMSSLHIVNKDKAIVAFATKKDLEHFEQTQAALDGFSNFLAQTASSDITVFAYETVDGKTKVSIRSKVSDVNTFAAQFGGGGHKNAAGFLSDLPVDNVVQKIIEKLKP